MLISHYPHHSHIPELPLGLADVLYRIFQSARERAAAGWAAAHQPGALRTRQQITSLTGAR